MFKLRFLVLMFLLLFALFVVNLSNFNSQAATTTRNTLNQVRKPVIMVGSPKIVMERVALDSPRAMNIYETKVLEVKEALIQKFAQEQKLNINPTIINRVKVYRENPDKNNQAFTRIAIDTVRGHMMFLPNLVDLAKVKPVLLPQEKAFALAASYVNAQQLVTSDASRFVPKQLVTLSQSNITPGGESVQTDILQTVIFQRNLDNLPVMGNGSQLSVNLGHQGQIVGFNRTWNQVLLSKIKPEFKSNNDIYNEIEAQIKQVVTGAYQVNIKKPKLVYYGNDQKYVQPAYFYSAAITSTDGQKSFYAGLVAAAKNSPEVISLFPVNTSQEQPGQAHAFNQPANSNRTVYAAGDDPTIGRYVVRNAQSGFVNDANLFKDGLIAGHPAGYPAITFGDYYWDYPWMWTTNEDSYVDKWNVVLEEGHGNNWLFTCQSNNADIVNLNSSTQPGYGDRPGDSMRFLIFKSCMVIPAPPDRSNWADPWWRVFKGLHQAIGARTEMYIDDGLGYSFGYWIGHNCRVLDSWFWATNNCSWYQWERFWGSWGDEVYGYGSVVMIPGHEGDGIYYTAACPPAVNTGLTIWWQH